MEFAEAWKLMEDGKILIADNGYQYKSINGELYTILKDKWGKSIAYQRPLMESVWQEVKEPVTINPCPNCGSNMVITGVGYVGQTDINMVCENIYCIVKSNPYCSKDALIEDWNKCTEKKEPILEPIRCLPTCLSTNICQVTVCPDYKASPGPKEKEPECACYQFCKQTRPVAVMCSMECDLYDNN